MCARITDRLLLPTLLLLGLGCGPTAPPPAGPAPVAAPDTPDAPAAPVPAAAAPAPESAPDAAAPAAVFPAPSIEGVPGWLGVRAGEAEGDYTSILGSTHLVIPDADWSGTPAGAVVNVVSRAGSARARFVGMQTGRFGCDGGTELPVAAFDASPTDDLVWIVPAGSPPARALPLATVDSKDKRTWTFGAHTLGLTRTGPLTVAVWAEKGTVQLDSVDMKANAMAGWDPEPLDLKSSFFLPQVVSAWEIGSVTVAAAYWDSFEGVHFTVYVFGETPTRTEVASVYRCAF